MIPGVGRLTIAALAEIGDMVSMLQQTASEVGERMPDVGEMMNSHMVRLTGPESDLALTVKNARTFMETLNSSGVQEVIGSARRLTDTLKREPWRILWPGTKDYPEDDEAPPNETKRVVEKKPGLPKTISRPR